MPYIGLCGIQNTADADVLSVYFLNHETRYTLGVGYIYDPEEKNPRHANIQTIVCGLNKKYPDSIIPIVHYSAKPNRSIYQDIQNLCVELGVPVRFSLQINDFLHVGLQELDDIQANFPLLSYILSVPVEQNAMEEMMRRLTGVSFQYHILFDFSGGRGRPIHIESLNTVKFFLSVISPISYGFAGGLNRSSLQTSIELLKKHGFSNFNTDAESGLRNEQNGFDSLEACAYLSTHINASML